MILKDLGNPINFAVRECNNKNLNTQIMNKIDPFKVILKRR